MRFFCHARNVAAHSVGGDTNKATDAAHWQLAKFDQAANGAGRDTAQLSGDFLKRPEEHGDSLELVSHAKHRAGLADQPHA